MCALMCLLSCSASKPNTGEQITYMSPPLTTQPFSPLATQPFGPLTSTQPATTELTEIQRLELRVIILELKLEILTMLLDKQRNSNVTPRDDLLRCLHDETVYEFIPESGIIKQNRY